MYKAILLDLGKVVIPFDLGRGYAALEPHSPYPPEELRQRIASAGIVDRFETGQLSSREFVARFSSLLGIDVGYERFCELWSSIFLPGPLVPESLLAGLRRRYRLLALSNTNAIHFEMVRRRYPVLRHFHDFVLSHEVGAAKPDPKIYQAAIDRAGCRPQECFFTDDSAPFVEAARRLGLDAVGFESAAQLERELDARGIEWR